MAAGIRDLNGADMFLDHRMTPPYFPVPVVPGSEQTHQLELLFLLSGHHNRRPHWPAQPRF
jgi:hypothetical protein